MRVGGKFIGIIVILATIFISFFAYQYTNILQREREQTLGQLASLPDQARCAYDASTCPQAYETIVLPDLSALGIALIVILLAIYIIRQDRTSAGILTELKENRHTRARSEEWEIIASVLTKDERAILEAVRAQPGISQATLRLRVAQSKAKLSQLLAELEHRNLIARTASGKTNEVHLKRGL